MVWDVFNKFLLIDATDRSKISSDQKRFFIALSLYPLSFFANTPFNLKLFNRRPTFCMCTWVLVSTGISLSFCSCSIYIIYYISAVIGGCLDLSLMYIHHKKWRRESTSSKIFIYIFIRGLIWYFFTKTLQDVSFVTASYTVNILYQTVNILLTYCTIQ